MQVTTSRLDIPEMLRGWPAGSPFRPGQLIAREGQTWYTPAAALSLTTPPQGFNCHRGENVRIDLVPYDIRSEPDLALAFTLALGVHFAASLGKPIKRLHIATGVPVDQLTDDFSSDVKLRFWLGFGVVV